MCIRDRAMTDNVLSIMRRNRNGIRQIIRIDLFIAMVLLLSLLFNNACPDGLYLNEDANIITKLINRISDNNIR